MEKVLEIAFMPFGIVAGLIAALLVEGAIFRAVRGVVDRGARIGFARTTGTWPGDPRPAAE